MSHGPQRRQSGFTLIEVMVVVAIIGLLASVAIPQYSRAQIRSRVSERATIMDAVSRAINDTVSSVQMLPDPANRTLWFANWNPPMPLSTYKRHFIPAANGWAFLPLVIQGDCYYSYMFLALDPGPGAQATLDVFAMGDLDGDGVPSPKQLSFLGSGYVFAKRLPPLDEFPPAGQEDLTTF